MTSKPVRLAIVSGVTIAVAAHSVSWADPGLVADFDVSQRLEAERITNGNNTNETFESLTNLGFGLESVTRTQSLSLSLNSGVAYDFNNANEFEIDTINSRLNYALRGKRSNLRFSVGYTEAEVDDAVLDDLLDEDVDITDIDTGDGTRETFDVRTNLDFGGDGPVTLSLRHSYRDRSFSDTTDPGLVGSTRQNFGATLGLDITPTFSLGTEFTWRDQDSDDPGAADRTTRRYALNARYDISPATTLTASVSETDIDTTTAGANDGGLGYAFGISHTRPNGQISANFSLDETVNGDRQQITVGRSFAFQRGDFNISAGTSKTGDFSTEPLVNVGLNYELGPEASLNLQLSQRSRVNSQDEETIRTRLVIGYNQTINSRSSFNGNLQLVDENVLNGGDQTTLRGSLSYRYDVGNDWDLVTGYEMRRTENTDAADRDRDTVFLGFSRSFSFRP